MSLLLLKEIMIKLGGPLVVGYFYFHIYL